MLVTKPAGANFDPNADNFIIFPGIIISLFLNILFTAYLATYSLDKPSSENFTSATLSKLVFTGPWT